jgi:tetratricopeptide (TPR) repeat protein
METKDRIELSNSKAIGYYFLKQYPKSKEWFDKTKKLDKQNITRWHYLGHIEYNDRNFLKAKKHFTEYLKINPNNSHILAQLGMVNYYLDDKTESQKNLEDSLKINPDEIDANYFLAHIFEKKDFQKAIKHYDKVLEIDQNNNNILMHKGLCYYNNHDYDNAKKIIKKLDNSLSKDETEIKSQISEMRGKILFYEHKYDESKKYLEIAIKYNEYNENAHEFLGHLEWITGNKEEAQVILHDLPFFEEIEISKHKETRQFLGIRTERDIINEIESNDIAESQRFEVKSSMYSPVRQMEDGSSEASIKKKGDEVTEKIIQTVVAFLNTDGGDIIIGVQEKPDKKIWGLIFDFKYLGIKRWDDWNQKTSDKIKDQIGIDAMGSVEIKKIDYKNEDGKTIILGWIQVQKRRKIQQGFTFLKNGTTFQRINASTLLFPTKSVHDIVTREKS